MFPLLGLAFRAIFKDEIVESWEEEKRKKRERYNRLPRVQYRKLKLENQRLRNQLLKEQLKQTQNKNKNK